VGYPVGLNLRENFSRVVQTALPLDSPNLLCQSNDAKTKQPQQRPIMGTPDKKRMWSWFINQIPAARLEVWTWWFAMITIILPILGGIFAWMTFEMSDRVSKNKEAEMTSRIAQAEAASRPKPFQERLIAQLEEISPKIIPALKAGQFKFSGDFKMHQLIDLQKLAAEPGASAFISLTPTGRQVLTGSGITNSAVFTISPLLLKE